MKYSVILLTFLVVPTLAKADDLSDYITVTGSYVETFDTKEYTEKQMLEAQFLALVNGQKQLQNIARAFRLRLIGPYAITTLPQKIRIISENRCVDGYWQKVNKIIRTTEIEITFRFRQLWWSHNQQYGPVEAPKPLPNIGIFDDKLVRQPRTIS